MLVVIRHEETGKYFQGFGERPSDDVPIWVDATGDAMPFASVEDEEIYRSMNLAGENAQPFTVEP